MVKYIPNNKGLKILTPNGFENFDGLRKSQSNKNLKFIFDDNNIVVTHNHRFVNGPDEVFAHSLRRGDILNNKIIIDIIPNNELIDVYDILETDSHTYIANNIVHHNCEFMGSSNTLLSSTTLKTLLPSTPIEKNDYTNQYIAPIKDHVYFIICDVSRGKGLDYSAFSVIDATTIPYVQVCTYRNNRITPTDYAAVILHIAKLYNTAYVLVETNDLGEQVSYTLKYEFDYENLLYSESAGRSGKKLSSGFGKSVETGLRTTQSVKRLGCSVLKLLLEQRKLVLHDVATVRELATFSKHGDSFAAESGFHDDMVMGLVLFSFITQDAYFKDITNGDVLQHLRDFTDSEIYDDLIPFGIITSASDNNGVKYVKIPGERGVWSEQSVGDSYGF